MATQNAGPLDITLDTTQTVTTVPMVAEGHMCKWKLAKVEQAEVEGKGNMLKFEYDLVDAAPNTEGGQIEPGKMGSKLFENIALFDKNTPAGTTPDWALKRIAQRTDALLGTGDPGNPKGKPSRPPFGPESVSQMLGRELIAKMKVKTGDFAGNEFGMVYFPGDLATA